MGMDARAPAVRLRQQIWDCPGSRPASERSATRALWRRCQLMLPLPVILELQDDMSVVNGATTEPRIRINRPDDENTRCRVSSARGQPKDFNFPLARAILPKP